MQMKNITRKIVTIGGGSGQYVLLSGLRDLEDVEITAIVSMAAEGAPEDSEAKWIFCLRVMHSNVLLPSPPIVKPQKRLC